MPRQTGPRPSPSPRPRPRLGDRSARLKIEVRPIEDLRADPRNPRQHPARQVAQIVRSITEFGWTVPILVDRAGVVIAGNARLAAARRLGRETVPVIVLDDLTPAARRAYQLADNRIPLDAEWDEALLAAVLEEISEADLDLAVTGFSDDELSALLEPPAVETEDLDVAPPLPVAPVTGLGDLWILGHHRLICGDATDENVVEELVTGKPDQAAELVFTDPPYGVSYSGGRARRRADMVFADPPYGMGFGAGKEAGSTPKGATVKAHGEILGDDLKGAALVEMVAGALASARVVATPGAAVYVCLTWRTYGELKAAVARAGLDIAGVIVWDKGSIGLGQQHYRPRHEFIFYCSGARWYGGRSEGDVWSFSRGDTEAYVHPTQKPVALVARAIRNSSLPGDVVLDVFGGSGSTLIACEQTQRRARLVELDPKYCDATLRRWQDLTGGTARRMRDGATFDDLVKA